MITASSELQTLAQSKRRKPTTKVYIKWDNENWTDESDYLKNVVGFEEMNGGLFEMGTSEVDIVFYNGDYHFILGHDNCSITEQQMVPKRQIKIEIGFDDENLKKFTGYIKSYTPDLKSGEFYVHAFDRSEILKHKRSGYAYFVDKTPTELIEWLGEEAGLTASEMDLETTTDVIEFAYFEDQTIWYLINRIAAAEGGRIFFDEDNILNFWNRFHLTFTSAADFTFKQDDYVINMPYEYSDKDVKNIIKVKAEARKVYETQTVWDVDDVQKDEFKRVLPHDSDDDNDLQFTVTLENPVTSFEEITATTDYVANTEPDGTGTDITSDISFVESSKFLTGLIFRIRNSNANMAYFTKFQVRGTPAKIFSRINVEVEDDYSIGLYDEHIKEIENPYIDDYDFAVSLAQTQLNLFSTTLSNFEAEVVAIPWLQPGDIVAIQLVPENDNTTNFLITKSTWDWGPRSGAKMTLELAINYAEYNKLSDSMVMSGVSHDFTVDSGSYKWGPDSGTIDDQLEWNLGAWD